MGIVPYEGSIYKCRGRCPHRPYKVTRKAPFISKGAFFALICPFRHIINWVKGMEILKYGGIVVLIVGALSLLIFAVRTKKFFKTLLLNAFLGLAVMAVIDLTAKFTGAHIPVNWWTVGGSAVFGIPAVSGYLILPLIFL